MGTAAGSDNRTDPATDHVAGRGGSVDAAAIATVFLHGTKVKGAAADGGKSFSWRQAA